MRPHRRADVITRRLAALTVVAMLVIACTDDTTDEPAEPEEPATDAEVEEPEDDELTDDAEATDDDADEEEETGGSAALAELTEATLILDFLPSAVHLGIYHALDQGYYEENNLTLDIIEPTSTSDTLRLIDSGEADFGIAEAVAVALEIDEGRDAQVIMALIQVPALALIHMEQSGFSSPADLAGGTVSWPGSPNGIATIDAMLTASGIDPEEVERTSVGFGGANSLIQGDVDAFLGTWASNAAQAELASGDPISTFRMEDVIGPEFPGLVFFSTAGRIDADPDLMAAFVDATVRGYEDALDDPNAALAGLLEANPALDEELQQVVLDNYLDVYIGDAPGFGYLDPDKVVQLTNFLDEFDLVSEPISPERYATDQFVGG